VALSAIVGTAARQDANDDDHVGVEVELEPNSPIADAKSPFVASVEAAQVERRVAFEQPVERCEDSAGNGRIQAAQVLFGPTLELERPRRLVGHAYEWSRLTSANGTRAAPEERSASTSAMAASSSGVIGSSSSGAWSRNRSSGSLRRD
jgi:hypothetical protein